jgi:hypothetical protein
MTAVATAAPRICDAAEPGGIRQRSYQLFLAASRGTRDRIALVFRYRHYGRVAGPS